MSSSSGVTLRRSTALVWRTLRSMRTALILLLMLALASVVGSLVPQWPNSPERVVRYQLDHPLVGALYGRAGLFDVYGSWWFVLITTLLFVSLVACLFPRTRALVRTLRQKPMQAREIDGVPAVRGARGAGGSGARDRGLAPRAAEADVPGGQGRRRPPGARRREGSAPRGREPALPLGVPADRDRRDLRQGHGVHRQGGGGGGQDLDRRAGQLRRAAADRPVLQRRLHRGRPAPARVRGHVPADRAADGLRLARGPAGPAGQRGAAGGHPGERAGLDRRRGVLPVRVRVGTGRRDPAGRRPDRLRARRVRPGHGARGGPAARDAVARHPQAAVARSADGSDVRAVAGQPRVAAAADDRRARRHDAVVPADHVLRGVSGAT